MKLDCVVIAAHPDDAEISLGGTILELVNRGQRVGVIDLTRGELGTRGSGSQRSAETAAASRALGLAARTNLELPDGRIQVDVTARERLAQALLEYQPELVFAQHVEDLHPDHAACGRLAQEAWYLTGLVRLAGQLGAARAHRPRRLYHFMGHVPFEPSFVVDVSAVWERKVAAIRCYASQLAPKDADDRGQHFLFGADILARAEARARYFGERIGVRYGEPLLHRGPLPADEAPLCGALRGIPVD